MYPKDSEMHTRIVPNNSAGSQALGVYLKQGSGIFVFSRHDLATSDTQALNKSSSTSQIKVSAKEFRTRLSMPSVTISHPAPMYHRTMAMMSFGKKTVTVVQIL